jgi:hypothetical protein
LSSLGNRMAFMCGWGLGIGSGDNAMTELEPTAYSFRDFLRELREIWNNLLEWFLYTLAGAFVGMIFMVGVGMGAMLAWEAVGWLLSWIDPYYPFAMQSWLSDVLESRGVWVFLLLFFGAAGGRAFTKASD